MLLPSACREVEDCKLHGRKMPGTHLEGLLREARELGKEGFLEPYAEDWAVDDRGNLERRSQRTLKQDAGDRGPG